MKEFDDILRNKLNEPVTPPDSSPVWAKVNAGLAGNGFSRWKTVALLSLLLWLLTLVFWYTASVNKNKMDKNKQVPSAQTIIKHDTISSLKIIHDTIIKKIYITKWKLTTRGTNDPIAENNFSGPTQKALGERQIQTENLENTTTYIPGLNSANIQRLTMDYMAKMKALSPEKSINKIEDKNELPRFDIALSTDLPQYNDIVTQKNGIAPKFKSSIFTLSTNYKLLHGLSFFGGITRQNISYEAAAITSSNKRVIPDPGNPSYMLDAVTIDQLIWGLNTGLSYDFLLKNKWILSIGSGVDWVLSGTQNNSYCFPKNGYLPENRIYETREAKVMTAQNAYLTVGADIPLYKQLSAVIRLKKYLSIIDQNWIVPEYSTEIGLKYYFY